MVVKHGGGRMKNWATEPERLEANKLPMNSHIYQIILMFGDLYVLESSLHLLLPPLPQRHFPGHSESTMIIPSVSPGSSMGPPTS